MNTPVPGFAWNGSVYGWVRIADNGTLIKVDFDPRQPEAGSTATRVLSTSAVLQDASISNAGLISYAETNENTDLYRLVLDPRSGRVVGEPLRLTSEPTREMDGTLSADGRLLAYLSDRGGRAGSLDPEHS